MTTVEERTARNEAQIEDIQEGLRTHFATKADLYRVALAVVVAQTAVVSIAVGVLLRFG